MDGDLYDIPIITTRRHNSSNLVYFPENPKKELQYCWISFVATTSSSETFCSPLRSVYYLRSLAEVFFSLSPMPKNVVPTQI